MFSPEFVVIALIVLGTVFFILGWNISVHRWRAGRERLSANVDRLEKQVNEFHEARMKDPQRGWTDVGTEYALIRIESEIANIRTELAGRKSD